MAKIQPKISKTRIMGDVVRSDIAEQLYRLCLKDGSMRHDLDMASRHNYQSSRYGHHKVVYVYTPKRVIGWGYVTVWGLMCVYVTPYWRKRGIGSMIVKRLRRKQRYCYSLPWTAAGSALYSKFKVQSRNPGF